MTLHPLRSEHQLRAWLVLGPSLVGFYPLTGMINPYWSSLSGWPLYWASRGHSVAGPHPWFEGMAFVGGPLAVLIAKIWLSERLLRWQSSWRTPVVALWAVSAFFVVPFYSAPELFLGWPIWCACE